MKDWTSFTFLGIRKFFKALNLDGLSDISSSEIICLKYVTFLHKNSHLFICNFRLCLRNHYSTSVSRFMLL